jgi:hypothetical protein
LGSLPLERLVIQRVGSTVKVCRWATGFNVGQLMLPK